jgi:hypothetical protein
LLEEATTLTYERRRRYPEFNILSAFQGNALDEFIIVVLVSCAATESGSQLVQL